MFLSTKKINRNVKRNHILTFFLLQNEEKEIKFEMPQNLPTREFKDLELLIDGEKMHNFTKKEVLQNLVQNYKEREVNLERKLLKFNSLREEQSSIAQIQKQLEEKTKTMEILKKAIGSLQSENEVFREKKKRGSNVKKTILHFVKPVFASLSSGNLSFNVGFPLTGIDKYDTGDGFGHFGLVVDDVSFPGLLL